MLDDDVRYWDLVRWNKLDLLDFTKNPTINQGAYVADAPIALPAPYVMQNGYMVTAANNTRTFDAKYNLYPIPSQQRLLNPNLKQNPGWE
ncbi:RagB/SusD family nutrient uptake outer membrane protein [Muribaculum intestinale]|nr:RagB/SusD family nutrient uptake outer membrane protein [Muribaculum intestinale]